MLEFLGRLHPLIVHMPIGILLLAAFFDFISLFSAGRKVRRVVPLTLLLGTLSGALAIATGFLLADGGSEPDELLFRHRLFAIITEVFAVMILAVVYLGKDIPKPVRWKIRMFLFLILSIALVLTGHFGGMMTHGENYLSPSGDVESNSLSDSSYYTVTIQPILEAKCYSCHGSRRQKGGLRLDSKEMIFKGGKHGPVIGGTEELLRRVRLPMDHKEHMPPREKTQLSESEMEQLAFWIEHGASFSDQLIDGPTSAVKPAETWIPAGEPEGVLDEDEIKALMQSGAKVVPIAEGSAWVEVVYNSENPPSPAFWRAWESSASNIASARFSFSGVRDQDLITVKKASAMRRLLLDNTEVSDEGIRHLSSLPNLAYINLVGTKVTGSGLEVADGWRGLRWVYLYRCPLAADQLKAIATAHPTLVIDTGGVRIPFLSTDTTEFRRSVR